MCVEQTYRNRILNERVRKKKKYIGIDSLEMDMGYEGKREKERERGKRAIEFMWLVNI